MTLNFHRTPTYCIIHATGLGAIWTTASLACRWGIVSRFTIIGHIFPRLPSPTTHHPQNITVNIEFTQGGRVVYSGVTFLGYVGLLTGMRPGVFSASIDERDNGTFYQNVFNALVAVGYDTADTPITTIR